jgi:chromosome segregation ATPase
LETRAIDLETNQTRLKNAHDTLTVRNSNLQEALQTTTDSFNELEAAQGRWRIQMDAAQTAQKAALAELAMLRENSQKEKEELAYRVETWQNQYAELNELYEARGKLTTSIENELSIYKNAQTDLAIAQARLTDLETALAQAQKPIESHTHEKDYDRIIKNQSEQIDEWQQHYEMLLDKVQNQERIIKNLQDDVSEWRTQFESLLTENEVQSNLIARLESQQTVSGREATRYDELESRLSNLTRRYLEINGQKEILERRVENLSTELSRYQFHSNPDDLKIMV